MGGADPFWYPVLRISFHQPGYPYACLRQSLPGGAVAWDQLYLYPESLVLLSFSFQLEFLPGADPWLQSKRSDPTYPAGGRTQGRPFYHGWRVRARGVGPDNDGIGYRALH